MTATPETLRLYTSEDALPAAALRVDALGSSLRELFYIEHPDVQKSDRSADERIREFVAGSRNLDSVWVYYPWRKCAIRIPSEETYTRLRTARNRNLITESEQSAYRGSLIGIAGLSVGSSALYALTATGGPKKMKLADPDTIEITNLNRIRATLADVGASKTDVAARCVWELDPFAELELWREGVGASTLQKFITDPRLDIFIDEMDDIELKFSARDICKKERIPVIMATDNGDGAILDVERFDVEPSRPIFHGRVTIPEGGIRIGDRAQFIELANSIIDPNHFTDRQRSSVVSIGTELSGVPQLATAAAIAGAALAWAVRQIATDGELPSGRYIIGCEQLLATRSER